MMKPCKICHIEKPRDAFNKEKNAKDGLRTWCKVCFRQYCKEWRRSNLTPERNKEYIGTYNKKHPGRQTQLCYEWRAKNYEHWRETYNRRQKERLRKDPVYKIRRNLRKRLWDVLKGKTKTGSSVGDLGCSPQELIEHLEMLFLSEMTWDNYGGWEVDHVVPLSYFDLTDREQLLKACHYTNLQPLWKRDNLRKSNRI